MPTLDFHLEREGAAFSSPTAERLWYAFLYVEKWASKAADAFLRSSMYLFGVVGLFTAAAVVLLTPLGLPSMLELAVRWAFWKRTGKRLENWQQRHEYMALQRLEQQLRQFDEYDDDIKSVDFDIFWEDRRKIRVHMTLHKMDGTEGEASISFRARGWNEAPDRFHIEKCLMADVEIGSVHYIEETEGPSFDAVAALRWVIPRIWTIAAEERKGRAREE